LSRFAVHGRRAAVLPVSIGAGGICLIFAALLCMLARAALDPRTLWRARSRRNGYRRMTARKRLGVKSAIGYCRSRIWAHPDHIAA